MSDLSDDLKKAYKEAEERSNQIYDGVMGELPHFPEYFQKGFRGIRNRLLKDYSHAELLGYIEERVRMLGLGNGVYLRPGIPVDITDDIYTLASFKRIDRVYREEGREACLALLIDPSHANLVKKGSDYSNHQSKNASKRRNPIKVDGEEFSITSIVKNLSLKRDFLGDPTPARELWVELYAELDKKHLNPTETDEEVITYDKDADGSRGEIKFSSFKAMMSKMRKS